jgi:tRNA pseudouridine55 synthase
LIIDKPEGLTSHDVVSRLRRILKTKKIGHTGTLDPFATGVLVMLVGKATRLAQFLDKDEKSYEAIVRFGFETETGDKTGELRITNYELRDVSAEEIEKVLPEFTGEIEQIPPMYSAKKIKGI